MFTVTAYEPAVWILMVTMFCWGSWPNLLRLTSGNWRFELFYWDYAAGLVVASLIIALTLGTYGASGRPFIADFLQADKSYIFSAMAAGILFNIGNLLFVAAINYTGMGVAFPIGGGLGLIIGILTNYLANPKGNPLLLFLGVACILTAILFSSLAHKMANERKNKSTSWKGIMLSVIAGCFFGVFFRLLASSMITNFATPEAGRLTLYTALVMFCCGAFLSTIPLNAYFMKYPLAGTKIPVNEYFRGPAKNHLLGVLAGIAWCVGLAGSLLATSPAGSAIAFGLSQGNALVASVWGVFVWKEFKSAGPKVNPVVIIMFIGYIMGLLCMIVSGTV